MKRQTVEEVVVVTAYPDQVSDSRPEHRDGHRVVSRLCFVDRPFDFDRDKVYNGPIFRVFEDTETVAIVRERQWKKATIKRTHTLPAVSPMNMYIPPHSSPDTMTAVHSRTGNRNNPRLRSVCSACVVSLKR